MENLIEERCEACRAGAPRVTDLEIAELHPQIPGPRSTTPIGSGRWPRKRVTTRR
jgi:hypothetical protein